MNNSCSMDGNCGTGSQCQSSCNCGDSCNCGSNCNCGDKSMELLGLVKMAKMSLLKDKMKIQLEAKMGKKLDQIAMFAVDELMAMYDRKKESTAKREASAQKMDELFN